jgi:hypothetical protein
MVLLIVLGIPVFSIVFTGWVFYRGVIKKDLRKYTTELYGGLTFMAVWVVLYYVVTHL